MATIDNAHADDVENIIKQLSIDKTNGLTDREASTRLAQCGSNRIDEKQSEIPFSILFNQFKSPFLILLFLAIVQDAGQTLTPLERKIVHFTTLTDIFNKIKYPYIDKDSELIFVYLFNSS